LEQIPEILTELKVHYFSSTVGWGPKVGGVGLFAISNYTVFLLLSVLLTALFWVVASRRAAAVGASPTMEGLVPRGIANIAEMGVDFVRNSIVVDVMGREGLEYFPFVGSLFFLVLFSNFIGLVPAFKAGTGTMGTTVTLALLVFIVFTWVNFKTNGFIGFWKSFVPHGVPKAMVPIMFVLELLSYLIRPVTLSVRLFANLFAGHVVLGVFFLFSAVALEHLNVGSTVAILTIPIGILMYAFELFVAFIQAYVFAILTAVYIGAALHASEH
jgi:F-type H+-transporting ATPase subunit a